jgi:hypothetical protein
MATDIRIKEQLPELTRRIVETYKDVPTIHYLGHCPLPNYESIIAACEDLKESLYPGYRRRENLHLGNVTYHVGDLIDGLHDKLPTQIGRALRHSVSAQRAAAEQGVELPVASEAAKHCTEEGDFEALDAGLDRVEPSQGSRAGGLALGQAFRVCGQLGLQIFKAGIGALSLPEGRCAKAKPTQASGKGEAGNKSAAAAFTSRRRF